MELLNATRMQAAYTMGTEPSAREHLVVAVKGTFAIPDDGGPASLAEEQAPLVMADEFWGEPGFSSPRYEVDFALRKPRCDVLLNATAYAPHGQPADKVQVGVKLGGWLKTFDVVGDRVWVQRGAHAAVSRPSPSPSKPITYDVAFGGVDDLDPDEDLPDDLHGQPGRPRLAPAAQPGERFPVSPLPNTEALDDPIRAPWGDYRPMGFGPIGRNWAPRYPLAGTYDQNWLDNVFPFLPADFDDRYYQAAPEDQQIDYPQGGEEVQLLNLTPEGRTRFRLPTIDVPVVFFRKRRRARAQAGGARHDRDRAGPPPRAPDLARERAAEAQHVRDHRRSSSAQMSRAWWRARELGKTYYPSIDALVRVAPARGAGR